ncbi:MerR family transcriptional regulator [Brumimicrobium aurantiacum]|uniref:MerR family transcriptional regulator n=1 Tax=Brumimicrobium aurantiacum TaxID=1737063 RepID=A0A3E1F1W2_9FLAO|nr:MerR family transcriptional regulator [Brumimicrobium aurantiacum]RFC55729.1 MerR family transcriptional regulator [Brumimicrobium aurantiacum]
MADFKIKDLAILTGIKAHTIRMWEKRYGLLEPERTSTKIRSYCDQDLVRLLNVAILYENGVKISHIAQLSEAEIIEKVKKIYDVDGSSSAVVSLLVQSMINVDCQSFERILNKAITKEGFETVYRNYMITFLERIGVLWMVGTISPLQEHFVSNIIRQKLIVEIDRLPMVKKRRVDAVLFTPEGEFHEISLLFYQYILKKRGFRTLYLGVSLPITNLKNHLSIIHPKNIVVSLVSGMSKDQYRSFIDQLLVEVNLPSFLGGSIVDKFGLPEHDIIFPVKDWIGE